MSAVNEWIETTMVLRVGHVVVGIGAWFVGSIVGSIILELIKTHRFNKKYAVPPNERKR